MKVYAVIERDRLGNERIKGLYNDVDKAFEVADKIPYGGLFKGISRSVEVMKVE